MNPSFWRGKKVLITGHTGFKGTWLTVWLQRAGASVVGYSLRPPTDPAMFELVGAAAGITSIEGDVCDLPRLSTTFRAHEPEIAIHLAAQALVKAGYADPVATYTTNVIGTLNVLEAVRTTSSTRAVLCVTSDKCYHNDEWVWGYRENDRMGGHDPYSSSKGCAELLISAYRDSYFAPTNVAQHGVGLASVRAGNVIGGGDWSRDRLVPDTMNAIMAGNPVLIRRPAAVRPWQFVLEPLRGYLDLAERLYENPALFAGAWNFGPDVEEVKPVQWLTEHLTRRWGDGASWQLDGATHPHEAGYLNLDCTKAKTLLGWRPALSLGTALDWIVEWYRAYHKRGDLRLVTEAQIARYERLASSLPEAAEPDLRKAS